MIAADPQRTTGIEMLQNYLHGNTCWFCILENMQTYFEEKCYLNIKTATSGVTELPVQFEGLLVLYVRRRRSAYKDRRPRGQKHRKRNNKEKIYQKQKQCPISTNGRLTRAQKQT
jgi:hypothetical protein